MLKHLLYFLLGVLEQIFSIAYYKTAQKNYDGLCAVFDLFRGLIWLFVVSALIDNLKANISLGIIYIIGCSIGDYISLKLEVKMEKFILRCIKRGRKRKRWHLINKYKK